MATAVEQTTTKTTLKRGRNTTRATPAVTSVVTPAVTATAATPAVAVTPVVTPAVVATSGVAEPKKRGRKPAAAKTAAVAATPAASVPAVEHSESVGESAVDAKPLTTKDFDSKVAAMIRCHVDSLRISTALSTGKNEVSGRIVSKEDIKQLTTEMREYAATVKSAYRVNRKNGVRKRKPREKDPSNPTGFSRPVKFLPQVSEYFSHILLGPVEPAKYTSCKSVEEFAKLQLQPNEKLNNQLSFVKGIQIGDKLIKNVMSPASATILLTIYFRLLGLYRKNEKGVINKTIDLSEDKDFCRVFGPAIERSQVKRTTNSKKLINIKEVQRYDFQSILACCRDEQVETQALSEEERVALCRRSKQEEKSYSDNLKFYRELSAAT